MLFCSRNYLFHESRKYIIVSQLKHFNTSTLSLRMESHSSELSSFISEQIEGATWQITQSDMGVAVNMVAASAL